MSVNDLCSNMFSVLLVLNLESRPAPSGVNGVPAATSTPVVTDLTSRKVSVSDIVS